MYINVYFSSMSRPQISLSCLYLKVQTFCKSNDQCKALHYRSQNIWEERSLLQEELRAAQAQEAELSEKLSAIHSQLEAQLLTNLEQEEEIRWVFALAVIHFN